MATANVASEDSVVRVYTTDTIVDRPGADIVYRGLIVCASNTLYHVKRDPEMLAKMKAAMQDPKAKKLPPDVMAYMTDGPKEIDQKLNVHSDILADLTEEAREKAKKLGANAIVGMKIAETYNSKSNRMEVSIIGTAVHFTPDFYSILARDHMSRT